MLYKITEGGEGWAVQINVKNLQSQKITQSVQTRVLAC